jgi:hypothetical protein
MVEQLFQLLFLKPEWADTTYAGGDNHRLSSHKNARGLAGRHTKEVGMVKFEVSPKRSLSRNSLRLF